MKRDSNLLLICELVSIIVESVNDYAVEKLASLEERYPVIVKPTGEIVSSCLPRSVTVGSKFLCNLKTLFA